jgi:hypothetical protein
MRRVGFALLIFSLMSTAAGACDYCKIKLTCINDDCWESYWCGSPGDHPGDFGGDCVSYGDSCFISNYCQLVSLSPSGNVQHLLTPQSMILRMSRCS